jgi:hypothetical protein
MSILIRKISFVQTLTIDDLAFSIGCWAEKWKGGISAGVGPEIVPEWDFEVSYGRCPPAIIFTWRGN